MSRFNNRSGSVLYLAIVLLLIISAYVSVIILSQHAAIRLPRAMVGKVQAEVLAMSGLSVAQAYISGYQGRTVAWETEREETAVPGAGSIVISARHSAGWLQVNSTGIRYHDTVRVIGLLGQDAIPFSENALNIATGDAGFVVADRAVVTGDIAMVSGKVTTSHSGVFNGVSRTLAACKTNDSALTAELGHAKRLFDSIADTTRNSGRDKGFSLHEFRSLLAVSPDTVLYMGDITITDDSADFVGHVLLINGKLSINGRAQVSNMTAVVKGRVSIRDASRIENALITAVSDVRIGGRAVCRMNVLCADTIEAGDDAVLLWPSCLAVAPLAGERYMQNQIVIVNGHATVSGVIITGTYDPGSLQPRVMTGNHATFTGVMFCTGAVTLYGNLKGSIYAGRVVYQTVGNVYDNWLMDAVVEGCNVSHVILPPIFPGIGNARYCQIVRRTDT